MGKPMTPKKVWADMGSPLQEVDADTYRRMWETDPQWQGYKRLYDAVYGDSPAGNDVEK